MSTPEITADVAPATSVIAEPALKVPPTKLPGPVTLVLSPHQDIDKLLPSSPSYLPSKSLSPPL